MKACLKLPTLCLFPNLKLRKRLQAYGIVWRAIDKKNNTVVALKKIFDAFQNATDAQVGILCIVAHNGGKRSFNRFRANRKQNFIIIFLICWGKCRGHFEKSCSYKSSTITRISSSEFGLNFTIFCRTTSMLLISHSKKIILHPFVLQIIERTESRERS